MFNVICLIIYYLNSQRKYAKPLVIYTFDHRGALLSHPLGGMVGWGGYFHKSLMKELILISDILLYN